MAEDEERIREYEERVQLETLKRKVSMMKFPAPERKKPKLAFSANISGAMGRLQEKEVMEMPQQLKMKSASKAVKLNVNMSQASKARIVDKPWKFSTKNVDECNICSNELFSVCHPHISSIAERSKDDGEEDSYSCTICRSSHARHESGRRKVVIGSSTLHNIWAEAAYKPGYHIDFDCIIGGQIHDVHASFLQQYMDVTEPMDIVIGCCHDNVPTPDTASDIIFAFRSLVKTIQEQNRDNRVVIASLLFAPKYCDVGIPPSRNMLEKVRTVNRWIADFNREATGVQLDLGVYGIEGDPMVGEVKHRYTDWREPSIDRKLHFSAQVKAKIASQLVDVYAKLAQEGIIC